MKSGTKILNHVPPVDKRNVYLIPGPYPGVDQISRTYNMISEISILRTSNNYLIGKYLKLELCVHLCPWCHRS